MYSFGMKNEVGNEKNEKKVKKEGGVAESNFNVFVHKSRN